MTKADLHRLIDELPDTALDTAAVLLSRVVEDSDWARLVAAPWDDEPLTDEEIAEHKAALKAIEGGEGIEWEEAKRRLRAAG